MRGGSVMFLDFNDLNEFDEVEQTNFDSKEPVPAIVNNEKVR